MILATPRRRIADRREAFTLLEVLVVVAILVILASVATVATTTYLAKARDSSAQLRAKALATAAEAYMLDPSSGGNYPTNVQELHTPPWGGPSFLKDYDNDIADPWGRGIGQWSLIPEYGPSGALSGIKVSIQSPTGVTISNKGINK